MRLICPLIAMLLLFSAGARAGDEEENIDCENIRNTVESNFCADKDLQSADTKLNALYKKVLTQISEDSLEKPYDRKTWENALRESQRAWMSFRDLDCKGVVPLEWSGGTGTTAAVLICLKEKTETRTKELSERYGQN
jgi:uncharacterized protein YecT (DUF1311 family)